MRLITSGLACSLLMILVSCGGGGGGGTTTPAPAPQPQAQSIAFATTGPVSRPLADATFTNAASGGPGTGAISYQSSNTSVATVSATGVVTFVAAGSTTITATKTADASYLSASANYSLTITSAATGSASFTAWLGEDDARVSFPLAASGIDFLRTTQLDCVLANFPTCASSQSSTVGTAPVLDTAATLTRDARWWLRSGTTASAPVTISLQKFRPRASPTVGSFRGKLWVVGGAEYSSLPYTPVWNSDDGVSWTPVTTFGDGPYRLRSQLVEFNNRLYLIGGEGSRFGYVDDFYRDDVWSTADGITWTETTPDAPWSGRWDHSAFVFNGRLWIVSGAVYPSYVGGDDAWSSADGRNWVQETSGGPFSTGAMAAVMNGRIWVVGGTTSSDSLSASVYSSADGRTWRTETTTAPYPGRLGAAFHALNGRLYLIAGWTGWDRATGADFRANDVWSSADGINWVEEVHEAPFNPRYGQGTTVHDGRIWVVAGDFRDEQTQGGDYDINYTNEVWSTSNGSTWQEHSPHAGFYASAPDAISANGRMWIVGGNDAVNMRDEIWSSSDGGAWTPTPAGARFPKRGGKGLVWFNNQLWISGGASGADNATQFADVWNSADGGTWTRATQNAAFGQRYAHAMVVFNNEMYVIGGIAASTYQSDVWRSRDGVTWTQVTASAAFGARYRAKPAVFGGRLWIFGGSSASGVLNDAWSTADGANWQRETGTLTPQARSDFGLTIHGGRLFLSGGFAVVPPNGTPTYYDDVWSSADGITWTQVTTGPKFSGRRSQGFLSFDDKLWVLGGFDDKYPRNDVWSSDDNGAHWRMRYAGAMRYP